ncbi:MAG: glycosyltransferase family 2 protein [Paludibacteraceae bacterium]|nr:glycosyltransferase family 2 protein [Paludibacteraceae bacterium]
MKCSVVILNWNGAEMMRRYMPSVVQHTDGEDIEVVVADNGSTDESLRVLREEFPSVRIIVLDRNYGFAEGYNRAIAQIKSKYTVLLNSDVEVTAGWLTPLLSYMDSHQEVAACQPKILSWTSKERGDKPVLFEHAGAAGGMMDALGYPFCRGRVLGKVESDHGQYDSIVPVFWTSGAAMVVRTAVYQETGGLDAGFFAHMEEIDLCWRMQCRGYRLVCVPQSVVYHLGGGSLNYESPRKTYLNFRNNMLMLYKNLPAVRLFIVFFCRFILDYAAALQYLLKGLGGHARSVVKARGDFWRMLRTTDLRQKRKTNRSLATVSYPSLVTNRLVFFRIFS